MQLAGWPEESQRGGGKGVPSPGDMGLWPLLVRKMKVSPDHEAKKEPGQQKKQHHLQD